MADAPPSNAARNNMRRPPGPRGRWFISNVPDLSRDPLDFYFRIREDYGDVVRLTALPGFYWYFVAHPASVEHILQTNQQNYLKARAFKKTFGMLLGEGLFTSEGGLWRRQRRLAQPAFQRQRLAMLASVMTDATERMLVRWGEYQRRGESFDIAAEMTHLTLEIAGRTLFSIDISEKANRFGTALRDAFEYIDYRMSYPITLPPFLPTPRNRRFKKAKGALDDIVHTIIRERRSRREDKGDLLSMLLLARDEDTGEGMTDEQLRDEVLTILVAGHETIATALAWTWYVLAKNPEVATNLRFELEKTLRGRSPTHEDLPKLIYTRMIFEEVMRLYPPAWVMMRQAREGDTINGYDIPPKALIVISQYVTHRHPDFWEEPAKFEPERFTVERAGRRPRFAYFPFGGGSRQCMGNNYAMMEAQLVLASVAQSFHPQLVAREEVDIEPSFTLRPKNGLMVTV